MIVKVLVFAFAFAYVSCCEFKIPQDPSTQFISFPLQNDVPSYSSNNLFTDNSAVAATPVAPENLFCNSAPLSPAFSVVSPPVAPAPVVDGSVFSGPICGGPVCGGPVCGGPVVDGSIFGCGCGGPVCGGSVVSAPIVSDPVVSENPFSCPELLPCPGLSFAAAPTNGPDATPLSYVRAPAVTLPAVESPVVTISNQPIPAPKVISQRCICTKTIVKPQIIQRTVTIPKLQRYLKRTVTPIVENISYKTTPITQGTSPAADIVIPGSASVPAPAPVLVSDTSALSSSSKYITDAAPVVVSSGPSCPKFY